MVETIYAVFADTSQAEKAAGALLDYGVRAEDLSLIARTWPAANATERAAADATSAGNRVAQAGDRAAASVSSTAGAQGAAANYEAAAERREATAISESWEARTGAPSAAETHQSRSGADTELAAKTGLSTTTPKDAGVGATKGAGIGLGVGVLAGLASLFVPGIGLVLGGGALATAIGAAVGTTVAGAVAGGVYGYLKDQGVPEAAATAFTQTFEQGGAILAVHVPSGNVDRAAMEGVLSKYGATSLNTYHVQPA